jgi:DNA-binding LytR/AlgR family response regulator
MVFACLLLTINSRLLLNVTSHQYAIEAFEAGAIDYLLKPVGQERLAQSVQRVQRTVSRKPEIAENLARLQEIGEPKLGSANAQKLSDERVQNTSC